MDTNGVTAFIKAVSGNPARSTEIITVLLEEITTRYSFAGHVAAAPSQGDRLSKLSNNSKGIELYIKKLLDIRSSIVTALGASAMYGATDTARLLLANGADTEAPGKTSPLGFAISRDGHDINELVLQSNANLDPEYEHVTKNNILHFAASSDSKMLRILLRYGICCVNTQFLNGLRESFKIIGSTLVDALNLSDL